MEYTKIRSLYSAIFTHASNSPLRLSHKRRYTQVAKQIHFTSKGKNQPMHVEETAQQCLDVAWEHIKTLKS